MKNKLQKKLKELSAKNEMALIIGTVPEYPDLETSLEIIKAIEDGGADILELSASFSDPVADGPTLEKAHQKFLNLGINKNTMFDFYKKIHEKSNIPTFIIEYANIIYKIGPNIYFKKLNESGINNIVIPDVPTEELGLFEKSAANNNVKIALLISPVSSEARIEQISHASRDFIYAVSVTGVTGEKKAISQETENFVKKAKQTVKLPLIVGFGINNPEQIQILKNSGADGVIICSAIINLINKNIENKKKMLEEIKKYVKTLKTATIK